MLNIGIISPSNIAFNRFLPSLMKSRDLKYVGVAVADPDEWEGAAAAEVFAAERERAEKFRASFGGEVFSSYQELLQNPDIQAIYVPLPPVLHYKWGKKVLEAGKHLLMEKPFTTSLKETEELLDLAKEKRLAVHENYMFVYHSQLTKIKELIADGTLGEIRLYRMAFGFPKRGENDFRYKKNLGGGALLDCGGYPVRLATELLGDSIRVVQASLSQPKGYEVDLFGSAVLQNEDGMCAQVSFGMDNAYQCQLEVWGSKATLIAPRIFTAGTGFEPSLILRTSTGEETVKLPEDDQFLHSIERFAESVTGVEECGKISRKIRRQADLISVIAKGENRRCR